MKKFLAIIILMDHVKKIKLEILREPINLLKHQFFFFL
jgi:hypothetical protein